jgi:hypothetical protein
VFVKCLNGKSRLRAFPAGALAVLTARSVEIAVPMVVSLTVWRAGVLVMKLNGKSRIIVIGTYKGTVYDSKWEMSA